jgi:hypothetical protein
MSSYQNERHREGKDVLQPQDRVNGLTSSSYKVSKRFALSSFTTRPEVNLEAIQFYDSRSLNPCKRSLK